jgi:hypothetical protein
MDRRSFLKVGGAGTLLPVASRAVEGSGEQGPESHRTAKPHVHVSNLPPIPTSKDLASDQLTYEYSEIHCLPFAVNEWGLVQATRSVTGIANILFPPFACCGAPSIPTPGGDISPGNLITCEIFLNGRILSSYPLPESKVSYKWYPHVILRETQVMGIEVKTETFVPVRQRAAAERIHVRNASSEKRNLTVGFDLRAGVSFQSESWYISVPYMGGPAEADNRLNADLIQGIIAFESLHTRAISIQGLRPVPHRVEQGRVLVYNLTLNPGEERVFQYVNVLGADASALREAYTRLQASFKESLGDAETNCNSRIRAAFTPGNSEYSGSMPQLVTHDPDLWKIYYAGFLDIFLARRTNPASACGPTYVTVPRDTPTLSYIWDTALSSLSLALLDPVALRTLLELWFVSGMDQHYATDYISGKPMGPWYAANDLGLLRCADDYLKVTGDWPWLDKSIEGKPVLEHLAAVALHWKKLDRQGRGLADYGGMENLLEAVSTYLHEVAAMNAGNVYGMRFVARLLDRHGDSSRAARFRREAKQLAERINQLLYVEGKGWWKCGQPDGTFIETRHCFDLLTTLDTMIEDLSEQQKKEMANFFWTELHTPLWMSALSPGDADASWAPGASLGMRSDHTWIGAYVAWPPMTARGLYKIESSSRVSAWVREFAKTARQGTFGQAHFVDSAFRPDAGGARKDPAGGWYEVAGGCFSNMVIDSIFGVELTLDEGIRVRSHIGDFDGSAQLLNLRYQGKYYTISREGARSLT